MNLTQLLHRNLQQRPQQQAICYQGQYWTYAELADRVGRLASALQQQGMGVGDRVAVMSLNSARYIEYLMAVPWGGGVLNPVNIRWSAEEIAYSLEDSGTRILLVDSTFAPLVEDVRRRAPVLETVIYTGEGEAPGGLLNYECLLVNAQPIEDVRRSGDDLLGIFYTGGTTGFPKGVMLSHANVLNSGMSLALATALPQGLRYLHAAPMFHLADLAMCVLVFLSGGTHVVVPMFDAEMVMRAIEQERVSDTLLVPTMVQMLLDAPGFEPSRLTSLERIIYGASPMPIATVQRAMEALPQLGFFQAYGMTELAPLATISPPDNHTPEALESGMIRSAGRAGPLQEIRIVDKQCRELPSGEVGEIIVRGPNVMMGYWNAPDQTAQAIVDGWMHTGDGGYMDEDGWLFVADRVKDMIISGGENIYSAEVENVISQHPDVAQCAVIAIPSDEWGEAVHAVIVPVPGAEPAFEEIRSFCKQHIAGYKCPRSLELIEGMPLSGAGKILKTELRKHWWQGRDGGVA